MTPDIVASIRARLLNHARQQQEEFERTLTRYAAERLLYRLGESPARDRCILKGASLLSVWLADPYRVTRDVDVLASGAVDDVSIRILIEQVCNVSCPEDGIVFDLSEMVIETIRPEEEYSGIRVRFRAFLGKARVGVQIDLGVGDAVPVETEEVTVPAMLPSMPAPTLRAYPRELAVAEKYEAMVTLGTRNSRMKDFHDIWALSGAFAFDGATLQRAVAGCFERRRTAWSTEASRVLAVDFYQAPELVTRWRSYLAGGTILVPPPEQFGTIGERIISFLDPVREHVTEGRPFVKVWAPGGPWSPTREFG